MPRRVEKIKVAKISQSYQKKGVSKKRADYIGRATVYGSKKGKR